MLHKLLNITCPLRRNRVRTCFRWAYGSWSFSHADWIKLMIAAARPPLRKDPASNQLVRTSDHGMVVFSMGLLSMGTASSFR